MRWYGSALPIMLLALTACQNLSARSEDISTNSIRDGSPVSEQLKAGEEIHWTNKLGAPVSIIFSEPVSDTLSCGKNFNRVFKNRTEVTLDPDETVGLCFREPGTIRYSMKRQPTLAEELEAARSQNGTISSRVSDLERQLADRDREIAALRSDASDAARLSNQLSAAQDDLTQAQGEKDRLVAELAVVRQQMADNDGLAGELASAKQRNSDLEAQLADRDKELSGLRGDLSAEMAKLQQAQRGLIRALKPQIDQENITVDLNNERLLINLASGYLFGSGEDQLKPAGADALKEVGSILKDFPEYKVHVEGHTDNRQILGALKKRFPSNKELSETRAANAVEALASGGLSGAHAMGAADTKPVMPNTTAAGRAKNRRVEVSVTK